MTQVFGFVPKKSVADWRRVERKREVTSGTVIVLVDGTGSNIAGLGVAAPELAAVDRPDGAGVGGGRRTLTVYDGILDEDNNGAVRMAVWSTSS